MNRRHFRPGSLISALMLVLAVSAGLTAPGVASERTFALNYNRALIDRLIKRVAEETGRTILFDEQVRGNISVITKREVTESEAWGILESSLSILGFSLLPSTVGNWRIAKVADAVGEAPFVERADSTHESFVTTMISLHAADLQAVLDVLGPITGGRVTLVPYEQSNSLIASGPERVIARLESIADELDRIEEFELRYRVLRYRDVEEIERLVESWIDSLGESAMRLQVWSDERTNSILFRGRDDDVSRLSLFLRRLDQPSVGGGQIQILRVQNRDPEEIANLIRKLSQSPATSSVVSDIIVGGTALAGADFTIAVDNASRSLVVRADPATQIAVREMLEQLDEPPQLIAVDVTISEVRTPRSLALGFAFSVPLTSTNSRDDLVGRLISSPVPGGLRAQPGNQTRIFGRVARDTGLSISIPDESGTVIQIPIEDTAVIDGGQFRIYTEVLIQPHLILTAGEQHEIFVGEDIPVPTSEGEVVDAGAGTDGDPNPISQLTTTTRIERTEVGVRLAIEARASRKGKIQLDLDLELSSLVPSQAGSVETVGPSFLKETLNATARLAHGETAIIGVNRQVEKFVARSGVPWLSDIPFLGWLFTRDEETINDVRLVISVRARRVSSPAALVADTIRRRLTFQRQQARGGALPDSNGLPYGVRVTTRQRLDDAEAIAEGLKLAGHQTIVHRWSYGRDEFYDVYVVSLESMSDAAVIASGLTRDGWDPDLVLLSTRS